MRRILIEHARARSRVKRGGGRAREPLDPELIPGGEQLGLPVDAERILALDEAIRRVEQRDARLGEIVRLRFYAGLSIEQTAEALGISPRSVNRDWAFARAWLERELAGPE